MFTSLTHRKLATRFEAASKLAQDLVSSKKVTPEVVEDALKFVKGMPSGVHVLNAANCVASIIPATRVTIVVGGVSLELNPFFDLALAKDSAYFNSMFQPTFSDAKTFPNLDAVVFQCFLNRVYGEDDSIPEFVELVEGLRLAYEYEFVEHAAYILNDLICMLRMLNTDQLHVCYNLANELGEVALINALDCMRNSEIPHPFSKSASFSSLYAIEGALKRLPYLEFIEIDAANLCFSDLCKRLEQFKSLQHILIKNLNKDFFKAPCDMPKYRVSLIVPLSLSLGPYSRTKELDFIYVPNVRLEMLCNVTLSVTSAALVLYEENVKEINKYIELIIRGSTFYNLSVIPNTLLNKFEIRRFFSNHFPSFVEIYPTHILIKESFTLNDFLARIGSIPTIGNGIYSDSSDSD